MELHQCVVHASSGKGVSMRSQGGHAIYKAIHGSLPNDSRFWESCFSTTLIIIMFVYFLG